MNLEDFTRTSRPINVEDNIRQYDGQKDKNKTKSNKVKSIDDIQVEPDMKKNDNSKIKGQKTVEQRVPLVVKSLKKVDLNIFEYLSPTCVYAKINAGVIIALLVISTKIQANAIPKTGGIVSYHYSHSALTKAKKDSVDGEYVSLSTMSDHNITKVMDVIKNDLSGNKREDSIPVGDVESPIPVNKPVIEEQSTSRDDSNLESDNGTEAEGTDSDSEVENEGITNRAWALFTDDDDSSDHNQVDDKVDNNETDVESEPSKINYITKKNSRGYPVGADFYGFDENEDITDDDIPVHPSRSKRSTDNHKVHRHGINDEKLYIEYQLESFVAMIHSATPEIKKGSKKFIIVKHPTTHDKYPVMINAAMINMFRKSKKLSSSSILSSMQSIFDYAYHLKRTRVQWYVDHNKSDGLYVWRI